MTVYELIAELYKLPGDSRVMIDIGELMAEEFNIVEGFFNYPSNKHVAITLDTETIKEMNHNKIKYNIALRRMHKAQSILNGNLDDEL